MRFTLAIAGFLMLGSAFAFDRVHSLPQAPKEIVWVKNPLTNFWSIWTLTGDIERVPDRTMIEIIEWMQTYPAVHIRYPVSAQNGQVEWHDQVVLKASLWANTTREKPVEFK